jgi:hypothetical protein
MEVFADFLVHHFELPRRVKPPPVSALSARQKESLKNFFPQTKAASDGTLQLMLSSDGRSQEHRMRGCLDDLKSWMLPHQSSVNVIGHTPVGTSFLVPAPVVG